MNNEYMDFVESPEQQRARLNSLFPNIIGQRVLPRPVGHPNELDEIMKGYGPARNKTPKRIYLIGSLRNAKVAELGIRLRKEGYDIFDDWHAAGPEADDYWQKYETAKGNNFRQALAGAAARNVYEFDKRNLDASDAVIMVMPAGKSGHLELGYMAGKGKKTCIFMDGEPERFDVMYNFADYIALSYEDVVQWAKGF